MRASLHGGLQGGGQWSQSRRHRDLVTLWSHEEEVSVCVPSVNRTSGKQRHCLGTPPVMLQLVLHKSCISSRTPTFDLKPRLVIQDLWQVM